jgi:ribosomal protein S18 acetylase RimI-like enzyme
VTLRAATPDDVGAVRDLEVAVFGPDAWSDRSVREELTGPRRRALVACDPDVVGYVVTAVAGDVMDLQRIAVHPAHRRRGLARQLLGAAVEDPGVARVLLEVSAGNPSALALYGSEGFTEVRRRRRYYSDGSDAVVMERRLRR